jgi:hypothetical protein
LLKLLRNQSKIDNNRRLQGDIKQNIDAYNGAVSNINGCLEAMQLSRKKLPVISESDLLVVPTVAIDVIDAESVAIADLQDAQA